MSDVENLQDGAQDGADTPVISPADNGHQTPGNSVDGTDVQGGGVAGVGAPVAGAGAEMGDAGDGPAPGGAGVGAGYAGLKAWERGTLILFSGFIALVNMGLAWYCMAIVLNNIGETLQMAQRDHGNHANHSHDPMMLMLEVQGQQLSAHMFNLGNKTGAIVLSIGSGFALMALGFGLFTLGADGAFKLKADKVDGKALVLQAAAPGLLCFLLAAVVICMAITRPQRLELGGAGFNGSSSVPWSGESTETLQRTPSATSLDYFKSLGAEKEE